MSTKTECKVTQVWECPKCGGKYLSPLKVSRVTCHNRHNQIIMKLVEGPTGVRGVPKPIPVLRTIVGRSEDWEEEPPKIKVKAALVSDPALLLEALGIQTDEGE